MSRIILSLLLLCLTISFSFIPVSSEVIVSDTLGDFLLLNLTVGNSVDGWTVLSPNRATSPYTLQVFITDPIETGYTLPAQEQFFIFPPNAAGFFGSATLTSATYAPNATATKVNTTLGNRTNPNTAVGIYAYTFTIPIGLFLQLNMSYNSTANPSDFDSIGFTVANPANVQIVGDPQFIGLRGQSYQVHGIDGAVYNIITEKNTQVNSRFVFLNEGQCPIFDGIPDINCWSHPGSYLGEMTFQQRVDGKIHSAFLSAGSAKQGFSEVQVDGDDIEIGQTITYGTFSLTYISTHEVFITMENFDFELSNSDLFINQILTPKVSLTELCSHGLLGQTHKHDLYPTSIKYIAGSVDDYLIADNDIYGTDFIYNQFQS